jgi:hypothetical protein
MEWISGAPWGIGNIFTFWGADSLESKSIPSRLMNDCPPESCVTVLLTVSPRTHKVEPASVEYLGEISLDSIKVFWGDETVTTSSWVTKSNLVP